MTREKFPQLVKRRGLVRIEKLSVGYQVRYDDRFVAFFPEYWEAEVLMDRIVSLTV